MITANDTKMARSLVLIIVTTIVFGVVSYGISRYFIAPQYESNITMYVNNEKSKEDVSETKTLSGGF